jgi:hypothetical protein
MLQRQCFVSTSLPAAVASSSHVADSASLQQRELLCAAAWLLQLRSSGTAIFMLSVAGVPFCTGRGVPCARQGGLQQLNCTARYGCAGVLHTRNAWRATGSKSWHALDTASLGGVV